MGAPGDSGIGKAGATPADTPVEELDAAEDPLAEPQSPPITLDDESQYINDDTTPVEVSFISTAGSGLLGELPKPAQYSENYTAFVTANGQPNRYNVTLILADTRRVEFAVEKRNGSGYVVVPDKPPRLLNADGSPVRAGAVLVTKKVGTQGLFDLVIGGVPATLSLNDVQGRNPPVAVGQADVRKVPLQEPQSAEPKILDVVYRDSRRAGSGARGAEGKGIAHKFSVYLSNGKTIEIEFFNVYTKFESGDASLFGIDSTRLSKGRFTAAPQGLIVGKSYKCVIDFPDFTLNFDFVTDSRGDNAHVVINQLSDVQLIPKIKVSTAGTDWAGITEQMPAASPELPAIKIEDGGVVTDLPDPLVNPAAPADVSQAPSPATPTIVPPPLRAPKPGEMPVLSGPAAIAIPNRQGKHFLDIPIALPGEPPIFSGKVLLEVNCDKNGSASFDWEGLTVADARGSEIAVTRSKDKVTFAVGEKTVTLLFRIKNKNQLTVVGEAKESVPTTPVVAAKPKSVEEAPAPEGMTYVDGQKVVYSAVLTGDAIRGKMQLLSFTDSNAGLVVKLPVKIVNYKGKQLAVGYLANLITAFSIDGEKNSVRIDNVPGEVLRHVVRIFSPADGIVKAIYFVDVVPDALGVNRLTVFARTRKLVAITVPASESTESVAQSDDGKVLTVTVPDDSTAVTADEVPALLGSPGDAEQIADVPEGPSPTATAAADNPPPATKESLTPPPPLRASKPGELPVVSGPAPIEVSKAKGEHVLEIPVNLPGEPTLFSGKISVAATIDKKGAAVINYDQVKVVDVSGIVISSKPIKNGVEFVVGDQIVTLIFLIKNLRFLSILGESKIRSSDPALPVAPVDRERKIATIRPTREVYRELKPGVLEFVDPKTGIRVKLPYKLTVSVNGDVQRIKFMVDSQGSAAIDSNGGALVIRDVYNYNSGAMDTEVSDPASGRVLGIYRVEMVPNGDWTNLEVMARSPVPAASTVVVAPEIKAAAGPVDLPPRGVSAEPAGGGSGMEEDSGIDFDYDYELPTLDEKFVTLNPAPAQSSLLTGSLKIGSYGEFPFEIDFTDLSLIPADVEVALVLVGRDHEAEADRAARKRGMVVVRVLGTEPISPTAEELGEAMESLRPAIASNLEITSAQIDLHRASTLIKPTEVLAELQDTTALPGQQLREFYLSVAGVAIDQNWVLEALQDNDPDLYQEMLSYKITIPDDLGAWLQQMMSYHSQSMQSLWQRLQREGVDVVSNPEAVVYELLAQEVALHARRTVPVDQNTRAEFAAQLRELTVTEGLPYSAANDWVWQEVQRTHEAERRKAEQERKDLVRDLIEHK